MNEQARFKAAEAISAALGRISNSIEKVCTEIAKSAIRQSGADQLCVDDAEDALAEELAASIEDLYNQLAEDIGSLCKSADRSLVPLDSLARQLDLSGTQHLKQIGPYGSAISKELLERSAKRWCSYLSNRTAETCMELFRPMLPQCGFSFVPIWESIASALWKDRVRPSRLRKKGFRDLQRYSNCNV